MLIPIIGSSKAHHLERVQESGELVEPLRTIVVHLTVDEAIKFVDVGETQFIKVILTLQTLNRNWRKQRNSISAGTFQRKFILTSLILTTQDSTYEC